MRIESPRYTERFGSVRINDVQRVLELDSGRKAESPRKEAIAVNKIEEETIRNVESRMVVALPTKNENLKLFEGVVSGIPHDCLIIVISNSHREEVDRFAMEVDTLRQFCHFTQRQALAIHQKDPIFAQAIKDAGYPTLLGEDGLVRSGKAEGMLMGILATISLGKDYVGFIDTDNYVPGAALEYAKDYAATFSLASSPYVMIRILWRYKVSGDLFFRKRGRVSQITNRCLNSLISAKTGFETDVIKTGNAGEHAMSIDLAKILHYASGYAIEAEELVSTFEQFGGVLPVPHRDAAEKGINIFQIETRNPHIHEERGNEEHLGGDMLIPSLSVIYYSPLCESETKELILNQLVEQGCLKEGEEPLKQRIFPPLYRADLNHLHKFMEEHLPQYTILPAE
jgi:mannosyl-3-phosphoglycerate synthase